MERAFSPWFLHMDANPGLRPGLVLERAFSALDPDLNTVLRAEGSPNTSELSGVTRTSHRPQTRARIN